MNEITSPLPTICSAAIAASEPTPTRRDHRLAAARRVVRAGLARLLRRGRRAGPFDTPSRRALEATGVPDLTR